MLLYPFLLLSFHLLTPILTFHMEEDKHVASKIVEKLEPINGTQNFRITRKDNKSWYDGQEHTTILCMRKAKCEPLKSNICFGLKLPYHHTSYHLTSSSSQEQVHEQLQQYTVLKHIPKCWAVVQPFLCAIFKPKCEAIGDQDMVFLPSLEMCRNIMEPCKLIYNTSIFPEFLKCNSTLFPSECANDLKEIRFNTTGQCLPPLVHTDVALHFYPGITGCGLPCQDPMYTEDEHQQIRRLITWGLGISLFFNLFASLTFLIDWRSASKYPAVAIFYINGCFIMSSLGWLVQFFADSRSDIVCSKDGTVRRGEPSAGENLSCVVVFVLVYYFLIAACVWFVIFTYAWHMSFKGLGKILDRVDKKGAYFHLMAWSLPLIFTITVMALGEIDGSSIVGICFVGYLNHAIRGGFLLGPIILALLIGGFFLIRGLFTLISVRKSSKDIISVHASSKIKQSIMRCSVAGSLILLFVSLTIVCHTHEFRNSSDWQSSFLQYLVCRITSMHKGTDPAECIQTSRPSVALLQLQLLCLWGSAILMSSWVWTKASVQSWKRYIRRKCGHDEEEPVKLQKHKLIAQAFSRRKELHNQGRMSISFHNTHTDPVGLNFELNSIASYDFSSTWANNLPKFVKRRGALTGGQYSHSHSSNAPRRNSQDSQISFSLRHVSVESRRNSLDSQLSVKIAEMKTKVASRRRGKTHTKTSRRRARNNTSTIYTRKESTTSVESQVGTHILSALSSTKERKSSSMTRRTASAGLSKEQVDLLLANSKLILPFLQNQGLTTTSDEENGSMASFKIKDSQINFILKQKEENLSAGDGNGSDTRINIKSYQTDSDREENNKQLVLAKHFGELVSSGDYKVDRSCGRKDLRGSKGSNKSKSSRKSSRQSGRPRLKHAIKNSKTNKSRENSIPMSVLTTRNEPDNFVKNSLDSSFDSYCSELGPLPIQSSFSGVSVDKNNSRNSKRSCDVGIQANSHEIATQTLSSMESEKNKHTKISASKKSQNSATEKTSKPNKKTKNPPNKYDFNDFESHIHQKTQNKMESKTRLKNKCDESDEPLLNNKRSNIDKAIIIKKRNDASCNLSESKKLKQLLLP